MTITAFQTPAGRYVYSAWSNRIGRLSGALFQRLAPLWGSGGDDGSHAALRQEAVSLSLLPPTPLALHVFRPRAIEQALAKLRDNGPRTLVLGVTEECNLRCRYCAYSGAYRNARTHSRARMSEEHAMAALAWAASFPKDRLHIGFYGGEPLLRFGLVRRVVARARDLFPSSVRLSFGMTTNGVLLSRSRTAFLAEHGFDLFVSLDGPADVHDRYRQDTAGRPTFTRIWDNMLDARNNHTEWFRDHAGVNMTLAPPDRLRDCMAFLRRHEEMFGNCVINPSYLKSDPSTITEALGLSDRDLSPDHSFVWDEFLADCLAGRRPSPLVRALCQPAMARLHLRPMTEANPVVSSAGQCAPGERCHVDANGFMHMCEHIDGHFPLGHVNKGYDLDMIAGYLAAYGRMIEERCTGCWAIRLCRRCIPLLADGPALSGRRLERFCAASRQRIQESLVRYTLARDLRDDCFDFIRDGRYDTIDNENIHSPEVDHGYQTSR